MGRLAGVLTLAIILSVGLWAVLGTGLRGDSAVAAASSARLDPAEWRVYQTQYVSPEGRVIDAVNGGVSHSEGQGYGMILATAYGDRAAFDKIWTWTQANLGRPGDHLFCWKYVPGKATRAESVPDPNDASDGNLLIAWGLARAADKWGDPAYRAAALAIEEDIRAKLIREVDGLTILLPGQNGFMDSKKLVVNLSYWIFPALDAMGSLSGQPVWKKLADSGLTLIDQSSYGRWKLPPDWLALKPVRGIAQGFDPWFGYNAIRIPLNLIWGGRAAHRMERYSVFWTMFDTASFMPTWTDLSDDGVDSYDSQPGIKAIMTLARDQSAGRKTTLGELPSLSKDQSYYSGSLLLLSKVALTEEP